MVEGVESLGEVVTGGMAARAVEPEAGEQHDGHGTACLNCCTALQGEFCHACGQKAHVHRTLSAFWHDIAHSVFHFEGKIWRTLPMLAWRPGELTRRYVQGERARFVSPMALFLFSVFLMFAVISAFGGPFDVGSNTPQQDRAEAIREFRQDRAESKVKLRELEGELAAARAAGENTAGVEAKIEGVRLEMELQDDALALANRLVGEETAREAGRKQDPNRKRAEIQIVDNTGWARLDNAVKNAEENPSLLLYKLQTNAYKFSWALIPISVPFLWLLFLHRRRYRQYKAYDHVVFVTYSIAFMSIGFILLTLLRPIGLSDGIIGTAIAFVPPIHMYRQLKGAYGLSRFSAFWRTVALLIFSFVAAGMFSTLLFMLGLLG